MELSRQTENFLRVPLRVLLVQLHVSLPIFSFFFLLLSKLHFLPSRGTISLFTIPRVFYIPIDKIGYIKSSTVENYRHEIIDKNIGRNEIISENVNCSVVEKKRKRVSSSSGQRVITSSIITYYTMQLTRLLNAFFCIIQSWLITLIIFARV